MSMGYTRHCQPYTAREQQEIDTLHRDITHMQTLQATDRFRYDRIARIARAYEALSELTGIDYADNATLSMYPIAYTDEGV